MKRIQFKMLALLLTTGLAVAACGPPCVRVQSSSCQSAAHGCGSVTISQSRALCGAGSTTTSSSSETPPDPSAGCAGAETSSPGTPRPVPTI